ncbi:hypothetical protein, partial [Pontibacter rugosus]
MHPLPEGRVATREAKKKIEKVLQIEIKLLTLHPATKRTAPKGIKSDASEDGKRGKMFFYKFFERLLETEITEKGKSLPR